MEQVSACNAIIRLAREYFFQALVILGILSAITRSHGLFIGQKIGMMVRITLVSVIYKKVQS